MFNLVLRFVGLQPVLVILLTSRQVGSTNLKLINLILLKIVNNQILIQSEN